MRVRAWWIDEPDRHARCISSRAACKRAAVARSVSRSFSFLFTRRPYGAHNRDKLSRLEPWLSGARHTAVARKPCCRRYEVARVCWLAWADDWLRLWCQRRKLVFCWNSTGRLMLARRRGTFFAYFIRERVAHVRLSSRCQSNDLTIQEASVAYPTFATLPVVAFCVNSNCRRGRVRWWKWNTQWGVTR